MVLRFWLLLFLIVTAVSRPAIADCQAEDCIDEQQLSMSWVLGYGQRSNPLYGSDNLPLVVLPDIYYYNRYWFFDNGKIGSTLMSSEHWQFSVLGQLNQEKGYFHKWFSGNFLQFSATKVSYPSQSDIHNHYGPLQLQVNQVSKRPTAFDAGLQLDWFDRHWKASMQLWTDISKTYHGQHASISLQRQWQNTYGNWSLTGALHWKSAKLINTYYGINATDMENQQYYYYQGKPSWQPELRLNWSYPLTERAGLLAFVRYRHLDSAMTNSPLVATDHVTTWFLGMSYRFF